MDENVCGYQLSPSISYSLTEERIYYLDTKSNICTIDLQPKEKCVLLCLIENSKEVVSGDELAKVAWDGRAIANHSINRVLSNIRKKLVTANNDEPIEIIKTIYKGGYRLEIAPIPLYGEFSVSLPTKEEINEETDEIVQPNTRKRTVLASSFFVILVGLIYALVPPTHFLKFGHVSQIADSKTIKYDIAWSPNGENVVYSARHLKSRKWFLRFSHSTDGVLFDTDIDEYDIRAPVWINDTTLAFRRYNKDNCHIATASIESLKEGGKGHILTGCSTSSIIRSIALGPEETLLFTDQETPTSPGVLYSVAIESGVKRTLQDSYHQGMGAYKVFSSPDMKYMAILSSEDQLSTTLDLYDAGNLSVPVWSTTISFPLYAISLSDNYLVHKNPQGRFDIRHLSEPEEVVASMPSSSPVFSPHYAPTGFSFLEGGRYKQNISIVARGSNLEKDISKGVKSRNIPLSLTAESLYFASDRTGITQLWRYDIGKDTSSQISSFTDITMIRSVDFSETKQIAAIESSTGIHIYDLSKGFSIPIKTIPGFSPKIFGDNLLFIDYENDVSQIYQYIFDTGEIELISPSGAIFIDVAGPNLFYSKRHVPGIWKYNKDGKDKLVIEFSNMSTQLNWNINEGDLYVRNPDKGTIEKYNLSGKLLETLNPKTCPIATLVNQQYCARYMKDQASNTLVTLPLIESENH